MASDTDMTKALRRREARLQADDASTWQCRSCTTIIEAGDYCWQCASYWKDVSEGLFDHD